LNRCASSKHRINIIEALMNTTRRILAVLIVTALLGGCASIYIWAVQESSPIVWNDQKRIDLPLVLDSLGRPGVAVQIMGRDFFALLDSGSPVPTLRQTTVRSLGLDVTGGDSEVRTTRDVYLEMGEGAIEISMALVGDGPGDSHLTLGQEVFSQAIVDMDFTNKRLSLIHPDTFAPPTSPPLSVNLRLSRPYVHIQLGDQRTICAIIDTGFDSGLALSPKLVKELSLPTLPGLKVVYRGFNGRREEAPALAPLPRLEFAGQAFQDVPVIGAVPRESDECGNLLGMAVLSRQRLVFDLGKKRMWLLPNQ
jgi:hypothetical protein